MYRGDEGWGTGVRLPRTPGHCLHRLRVPVQGPEAAVAPALPKVQSGQEVEVRLPAAAQTNVVVLLCHAPSGGECNIARYAVVPAGVDAVTLTAPGWAGAHEVRCAALLPRPAGAEGGGAGGLAERVRALPALQAVQVTHPKCLRKVTQAIQECFTAASVIGAPPVPLTAALIRTPFRLV